MTPLDRSYRRCRRLSRRHGATYFWSTLLLPRPKQRHVHALYALARTADDIVDETAAPGVVPGVVPGDGDDDPTGRIATADRGELLDRFAGRFFADLDAGRSGDPTLMAVIDTVVRLGLGREPFERFFRAMAMDLTVTSYDTWDDLLVYMDGSAAVIGEMMLPVLEPADPAAAIGPARDLGLAFQLTNFLRDIGEDLDRGRQYLPVEDVQRFGVELHRRQADADFAELMRFEIARCRALYDSAEAGIAMLPRRSAQCIRAAHTVYGQILTRIERLDYDVFSSRARVPTPAKLALTARHLVG